jgi:hypothetical protein
MKNQYKVLIATAVLMIPMATAFAIMPSDKENQFIRLGYLEGSQMEIHKMAEQERIDSAKRLEDYAIQWQTMESERQSLHDSLFN